MFPGKEFHQRDISLVFILKVPRDFLSSVPLCSVG